MNRSKFNTLRRNLGPLEGNLVDGYARGAVNRRDFLVKGSVMGLSVTTLGAFITACGSDDATTADGDSGTTVAGGTAAGAIQQGGILKIAAQRPASPLDPVAMDNIGSYQPVVQSCEYLCGKGDGAALAPMLAESWSPNDDGSVWTFNLRSGVKWHDGSDFTSADVVGSLDRLATANLASYIVVGASEATDDLTVVVTLNAPDGQFPYQVSIWNPQACITPADYELGTLFDQRPVGTGAFVLDTYDVSTGATYKANPDWWGGTPFLDGVELIFADDNATQITGLLSGEADAVIQFAVADADALFGNGDYIVESIQSAGHRQLWMNTRDGVFSDVRVREAVALGIDRQALVDTVLQGRGDIGNDHPVAPLYEFWDSSQPQRERDVEKAKALLEEAGQAGLAVTLNTIDLQEMPFLAEVVQSQLKDIGMDITLNVETTYDKWCLTYTNPDGTAACEGGADFGIVDYGNRGTPDRYLVAAYATLEWNSAHYESEEFNAAVAAYQATTTLEDRKEAIKAVQEIANRDVPYVIPYFYNLLTGYKKNVAGIVSTGLGHYYVGQAGFTA